MYKILLVEDDKSLSVGLVYYLNKEGYHVTHTETIKETREVLSRNCFDIAILDVTLPDGNSYELLDQINEKNTPVVFLTALDEENDILKGFDLGAQDYITKINELLEGRIDIDKIETNSKQFMRDNFNFEKDVNVFADKLSNLSIEG